MLWCFSACRTPSSVSLRKNARGSDGVSFKSVDDLQKILADSVFARTTDRKKAAGRALGTMVEIITFYTLRAWGFRDHIVIERHVPEFANSDILHNVEFSLHGIRNRYPVVINPVSLPLTAVKISRNLAALEGKDYKSTTLLTKDNVMRNACVLAEDDTHLFVAHVDENQPSACRLTVCSLFREPFAIFECKRVGIEKGMHKGPQTIEKAKQGAYVARAVSSLQKVRLGAGSEGYRTGARRPPKRAAFREIMTSGTSEPSRFRSHGRSRKQSWELVYFGQSRKGTTGLGAVL